MIYAVVKNSIVSRVICGGEAPDGAVIYPDDAGIHAGADVRHWDSDGVPLSLDEATAAGVIEVNDHQAAVWGGGRWVITPDWTDVPHWVKTTGEGKILALGETPDDTLTRVPPPDVEAIWENGDWVVPDAVQARRVRTKRDGLLSACDYVMLPDYPAADRRSWEKYRQELRDIPAQREFPTVVNWPDAPNRSE